MFGGGPQFVYNFGAPGFRVHQFEGGGPRRRPRAANRESDEPPPTGLSFLTNLLPLLILFVLPLLSSIFSGDSTPSGPAFRFESPAPPYTLHRTTSNMKVDYYLNPRDVADYNKSKWSQLDKQAEVHYVQKLRSECDYQTETRNRMMQDAQGWFFQDVDRMREARNLDLKSCRRLRELGLSTRY